METLTNLAKQALSGWSNTVDSTTLAHNDATNVSETINEEAVWFHDLNQFIQLLNKRLNAEIPSQWDEKICHTISSKLLAPLDKIQKSATGHPIERSILEHWWVNILTLLDTDMGLNSARLLLVSLESISKIITQLIVSIDLELDHWENFYINLIKTCHYLRRQLSHNNTNMKQLNEQVQNVSNNKDLQNATSNSPQGHMDSIPRAIKEQNDEILEIANNCHLLLGQIIANCLIYLPDTMHFSAHFISLLTNEKYKTVNTNTKRYKLYHWHKTKYKTTSTRQNHKNENLINPGSPLLNRTRSRSIDQDSQCFKILVSYLKNNKVFMAFYWHYWYINLHNIEKFNNFTHNTDMISLNMNNIDTILPYATIIIKYSMFQLLKIDIFKYRKLTLFKNDKNNEIEVGTISTSDNDKDIANIRKTIRNMSIWNCLFDLTHIFNSNNNNNNELEAIWHFILHYHDKIQLQFFHQITAYETHMSNLLFNHILGDIITHSHATLIGNQSFLHWDDYSTRLVQLIKTLNFKNQINAMTFLFNHWLKLDEPVQNLIFNKLYPELRMLIFNQFNIISIMGIKLIIFKLSQTHASQISNFLQMISEEYKILVGRFKKMDHGDLINPMLFQLNKKFVISMKSVPRYISENQYTPAYNSELMCKNDNERKLFFQIVTVRDGGTFSLKQKITQFNSQWSMKKDTKNQDTKPSNILQKRLPLEPKFHELNLSLFPNSMEVEKTTTNSNCSHMNESQYYKYVNFVKKFNLTMFEYYEYLNLENNEEILIEHV